jgi:uncharacterized membrane protein YbhN (UPF0104 family)
MPGRRWVGILRWLPGTLLLVGLALLALRHVEWERFSEIVQRSKPAWLLAAVLLQLGTYVAAAATLQRGIKASGVSRSLVGLVPLGLAKLFVDQVVPTGGLGGTVLVVRALERRGVTRGVATAAVVVNTLAFYASYAIAVVWALAVLWFRHGISRAIAILCTLFAIYAVAMPVLILYIVYGGAIGGSPRSPGSRRPFTRWRRLPAPRCGTRCSSSNRSRSSSGSSFSTPGRSRSSSGRSAFPPTSTSCSRASCSPRSRPP